MKMGGVDVDYGPKVLLKCTFDGKPAVKGGIVEPVAGSDYNIFRVLKVANILSKSF